VIHSPLVNGAIVWPWSAGSPTPLQLAGAYGMAGALLLLCAVWVRDAERSATP
jgi:hypothetical protein